MINWGVLSTAKIGREKVIPAIQASKYSHIVAIASGNKELANTIAAQNNIEQVYGSYEDLLKDAKIEAVYIPLPNHMHVEWAIKALEAGKHVLCEKPIGLNTAQAEQLFQASAKKPELKILEAFMYRFHPQWLKVKSLISEGVIGKVKTINAFFSYYNVDPKNIRNSVLVGGGALMDIGCYCVSFPRFILETEPVRVIGTMDLDPEMKIDRMTSGILGFSDGITATFTCSTQLMPYQRVNILGENGRIEVEIPVNAPIDKVTHICVSTKEFSKEFTFDPINQYTLQVDYFAKAIMDESKNDFPLKDSINNMKVIDAIVKSLRNNDWVEL